MPYGAWAFESSVKCCRDCIMLGPCGILCRGKFLRDHF